MRHDGLSIVIPTYKQKYLQDTLTSLAEQSNGDFEVVVVENGCRCSDTHALIKQYEQHLDIQYHFEPQPGINKARNIGTNLAKNAIIAITDDDMILDVHWVDAIHQAHAEYPEAGVIGGKVTLRFLVERPVWCIGNFVRMLSAIDYGPKPRELSGPNPHEPSYLVGANLSYRKTIFAKIGGFCESPDLIGGNDTYNDEMTFTEGAKQYGQPGLLYIPSMSAIHQISPERTTLAYMLRRTYAQGVSDVAFYKYCSPHWTRRDLLTMWEEQLYRREHDYEEMMNDRQDVPDPDRDIYTEYFLAHRLAYLSGVGDAIRDAVDFFKYPKVGT
jgi:GT2 family glycosyltransferase